MCEPIEDTGTFVRGPEVTRPAPDMLPSSTGRYVLSTFFLFTHLKVLPSALRVQKAFLLFKNLSFSLIIKKEIILL